MSRPLKRRHIAATLLATVSVLSLLSTPTLQASAQTTQAQTVTQRKTVNIQMKIGEQVMTATLIDNETTHDFLRLLPLTLMLEDYANTEKISYLPRKLSTAGAPAGSTPKTGNITYYAPWGNLALFYKDFSYSSGLIKLGKFDGSVEALRKAGQVRVTFERVK